MILELIRRSTGELQSIETDNFKDLSIFAIDKTRGIKRNEDGTLVKCELGDYKDEAVEDLEDEGALLKAKSDYFDVFGKEVPVNKKNDIEWINNKVSETLQPDEPKEI